MPGELNYLYKKDVTKKTHPNIMPTAADLKAELRALRKNAMKPVSRMRVADVASEIQRLKGIREETPAVAAVPSAPNKKSRAAVETIQEARENSFPTRPEDGITAAPKKSAVPKPKKDISTVVEKKKSKLERLMEMLDEE
jgi:metal-dependent amidase/aminoacylase/carboxypeptidase family protein